MTTIDDIVRPLALTASLLARFWPQLLLICTLGYIASDLLLRGAVLAGLHSPLAGLMVLSLVVLTKLLVVVMMFAVLRPGLPALASLRQSSGVRSPDAPETRSADHMLAVTAVVILPFFAFYAAWGFLGDTVRVYSRMALEAVPFGERADIFGMHRSRALIASIVICWLIRWFAKRMNDRAHGPYWRLVIVAADASWIFIGLYALDVWKDEFITWIGAGALLDELQTSALPPFSMVAHAAEDFTPVEFRSPALLEQAQGLFFYALLPMVWLVMAAIINGYELSAATAPAAAPPSRHSTWRKWLQDFITHFFGGYRSRYQPVWTCLRLTLGAGLATLITFVIAYRLIGWLGAWLWYGASRTLDIPDLDSWQVVFGVASLFIGSPSDLDGGILLDAMRIALLAAVLEYCVASQVTPRARAAI